MAGSISHRAGRPKPWLARYRAPDGGERSKAFETKFKAERWLRDQLGKIDADLWVDPVAGQILFEVWAPMWLAGKVRLTTKTRTGYEGILTSRVYPTFGRMPIGRITKTMVKHWVAGMTGEGLSASRIRNCFNVLAACLEAAADEGLIGRNPARGVELPAQTDPDHRYLDAAEVDRLLASVPAIADQALIAVLAYGGLRWGEAVALRRGRVDVLARRLRIVEAATEVGGKLVFGEPKTHRRRTVQLPGFVAEFIGRHLEDRPADPEACVWAAARGGPLRYTAYRSRVWNRAVRDAGLDGLTPHDLRHSCASLMRAAGADVSQIQAQLGHRSPVVTLSVYTHLFEDAFDPVMDALDDQHRRLPRTTGGPDVVPLDPDRRESGFDQGV
jgi:integrase